MVLQIHFPVFPHSLHIYRSLLYVSSFISPIPTISTSFS
nr:MAG TPA: hypothetical protein [Caudoviricetes sp.]